MHLQAALQAFLLQLEADGRSPHTVGQYRRHCTALATWLAGRRVTSVAKLTPDLIAGFFADGTAKNSCRGGPKKAVSLNAMRTSVRCFAKHLHDSGHVPSNPARLLRRARCTPPPPRALHADEQQRLLDVLAAAEGPEAERDRILVELLLGTGIRISSALALDVDDLDLQHMEALLRRMKNDKTCTLFLSPTLASTLRAFVKHRKGPLFLARGRRMSTRHAQRRLRQWFRMARATGSAHALRHTFACSLLARTGNLPLVQEALHHESVLSTAIYARVDKHQLRAVMGK